ncbi:hypothetical protein HWV62_7573 [Athelia sp. TMB]|nr:hypothetical protein HWV62_7573 [Athelia sp. TMB]
MATDMQRQVRGIHDVQKEEKITRWMSAPDSSPNFNAAREKHQSETGAWFLGGSEFAKWMDQSGSVLWLHGGRKYLTTFAVESVHGANGLFVGHAYFFFDGRDGQSDLVHHEKLIRSLIMQFSAQWDGVPAALDNLYTVECKDGLRQPSIASLERTLMEIAKSFNSAYVIIDALDECCERRKSLKWIQSITSSIPGKLHLLVSSRPEPEIDRGLSCISTLQEVNIAGEKNIADIQRYLDVRLAEDGKWSDASKHLIRDGLVRGADGMRELEAQLKALPRGLNDTYAKILTCSPRPSDLKRFLQCLAFSNRPMTVVEIAEVATIHFGDEDSNVPVYESDRRFENPKDVLSICYGLITEVEGVVKLAHYSVKEFLLSEEIQRGAAKYFFTNESLSHCTIAQICLAYLLQLDQLTFMTQENIDSFPLAPYAANRFASHVRSICSEDGSSSIQLLLQQLFGFDKRQAFLHWARLLESGDSHTNFKLKRMIDFEAASPLYYASSIGLLQLVQHLVDHGSHINVICGEHGTALGVASTEGHADVVKLLLENGANANVFGGEYGTALGAASTEGHAEIVELLLKNGADPNIVCGEYGTALGAASYWGYADIIELLLKNGADVNNIGGQYGTALGAASFWGRAEIVELLLANGADVNVVSGKYGTPLGAASFLGRADIIELLLKNGADVNNVAGENGTALGAASFWGRTEIVKLLLTNGADVNIKHGKYGTPLGAASFLGHADIVRLLQEAGQRQSRR